ncbi:hypothetical protein CkaCkLH20_10656 [Colletotrichum karsti]|uniref:F-box domain-containing protein n=1 Tax=Colletotrichum karsti TaxID=1095194 RepID=A0A9P6HV64_9PEZI|nr:uncharacterized protein CkaCkLH20_10656 [Colletotrichum karsti]KAF9871722.1 hypothetical protein CkaCkLH20_10656 [Colletotrichum karsti]
MTGGDGAGDGAFCFLQLPVELQITIISLLHERYENIIDNTHKFKPTFNAAATSALAALCIASRHTRSLAEPLLYREFCHHELWMNTGPKYFDKLAGFVWTLHQRPELGKLLQRVRMRDYTAPDWPGFSKLNNPGYPHDHDDFLLAPQPCADKLQDLADRVDVIAYSPVDRAWVEQRVPMRRSAILLQLLLVKTPNLEELFMETLSGSWDICSWTLLQEHVIAARVLSPHSAFPHLKTLTVHHALEDDFNWGLQLSTTIKRFSAQLSVILGSRNVEELSLDQCVHVGPIPMFTHLTSINLWYCHLARSDIKRLLSSCDGLRSFSYEAASYSNRHATLMYITSHPQGFIDEFDAQMQATPREMQSALMRHKDTLEAVEIRQLLLPQRHEDRNGSCLSWKSFTNLKRLVLKGNGLVHPANVRRITPHPLFHLLPDDIEEFDLDGVFNCDIFGFREYITAGCFHKLQKATFGYMDELRRTYQYPHLVNVDSLLATGVAQALISRGVEVEVVPPNIFWGGPADEE